jgi:hypothetical protein
MRENESKPMRSILEERQKHGFKNGEWLTFTAEVTFTDDDLNPTNVYQTLRIDGPGPNVAIEFDHFELRLPPQSTYPPADNVCFDLVPGNNDADAVMYHPFPFRSRVDANVLVQVKRDETDLFNYFAVSGRSSAYDGISWDIAPGCVRQDAVYR